MQLTLHRYASVPLSSARSVPQRYQASTGAPLSCLHQRGQGWRTTTRPRQLDNAL